MDKEAELNQLISSISDYIKKNYKNPALSVKKPAPKPEPEPVKEYSSNIPSQTVSANAGSTRYSLTAEEIDDIDSVISDMPDGPHFDEFQKIQKILGHTFVQQLNEYILKKRLSCIQVYNDARLDRRLFSKMMCDDSYRPSKDTCIALCLALKLTYNEARKMLESAGYAFSHANLRDVILEYFFYSEKYDIDDINEILYQLNQKPLGR